MAQPKHIIDISIQAFDRGTELVGQSIDRLSMELQIAQKDLPQIPKDYRWVLDRVIPNTEDYRFNTIRFRLERFIAYPDGHAWVGKDTWQNLKPGEDFFVEGFEDEDKGD